MNRHVAFVKNLADARSATHRRDTRTAHGALLRALLVVGMLSVACGFRAGAQAVGVGQLRRAAPPGVRPNGAANRQMRAAIALLRSMLRPRADYAGEERTWIVQTGSTSHQFIRGNTKGLVLRRFDSPPFLQGDVMLTGPGKFVYYSAKANTVSRTPPGGSTDDARDRQIIEGVRDQIFVATCTGQETIAGVDTVIVMVFSASDPQATQGYAKFWIDPLTGIRMKIERREGDKLTRSELSNVVIGPQANVTDADFSPPEFRSPTTQTVQMKKLDSIQQAIPLLTFAPLEPGQIPPGFRQRDAHLLTNMQFPSRVTLVLGYSDGMSRFTLSQRRVRAGQRIPPPTTVGVQRWSVPMGAYDIDVTYRGRLTPQQVQMIRSSLQPVR